jgi:AraC-like DNA-binding protein
VFAREDQQAQIHREELIARIMRVLPDDGMAEPLDGVLLRRATSPTGLGHGITIPAFCVIAQGRKEMLLGDKRYWYDPAHYLIATAALPVVSRITDASPERPYLSVLVTLDPALVGAVMAEAGHGAPHTPALERAITTSPLDPGLLDAIVRLVRSLDSASDAQFLAPAIKREIIYRLFQGAQGARLSLIAALGGNSQRMAEAIERFRSAYNQPLRIDDVAHHHFKALTAMSPLQFQKQLRLQEARRLMLGEGLDAASAGKRVGYENASYFNREYKKLFGEPPLRDVASLRGRATERANL